MKKFKITEDELGTRITYLDNRWYECDDAKGEYVPSNTTKLKAFYGGDNLAQWLKETGPDADRILREAGEQGTKVHDAIERWHKEGVTLTKEMCENMTMIEVAMTSRFIEFADRYYTGKWNGVEVSYGSKLLDFGGTIDYVGELSTGKNGAPETWIIDYKTSNAVHDSYYAQIAAYKKLYEIFNPDVKIDKLGILHLKTSHRKDGDLQGKGWKLYSLDETGKTVEEWFDMFNHAAAMWRHYYKATTYRETIFDINIKNKFTNFN